MSKTFYSPVELLRKQYVVPSLIASVCIVVVLTTAVGLWLNRDMIYVSPIAEARFVSPPPSILYGYLANMTDVCKLFKTDDRYEYSTLSVNPIVVVVKTAVDSPIGTIGTMTIGKDVCEHIKQLKEIHLYVVSNVPFRGIYFTPQYFNVAALKK